METHTIYLFYLALILILGILITAITHNIKLSNILFLVLAGYALKKLGINYFNNEITLVLSTLALIMIALETSLNLDLKNIFEKFFPVLKFSIISFFLTTYILTLITFQLFGFEKTYEIFVYCLLLSIIIYGVDPLISMEFFKTRKHKVKELLEMEGLITSPIVVAFSFFIINQATKNQTLISSASQYLIIFKELAISLVAGIAIAWIVYNIVKYYPINQELTSLLIISSGIAVFVINQLLNANGSFSVIIYGLFLRGLGQKSLSKKYTSMLAHILFIIVFILFGIESVFPEPIFLLKGSILFITYLILRFLTTVLFIKGNMKEKVFFTLNIAKGIEIAIILFIMRLTFEPSYALDVILSLGFLFFIFSYLVSTIANHYSHKFLNYSRK